MFNKKKIDNEVDVNKVNDVLSLLKKILKIAYILIIIIGIYAITMLVKEWNILIFLKKLFKIVSPLFIGIVVAWLLDPFVKKLKRRGIRRGAGTAIVYIIMIGCLVLIIGSIIPLLTDQINDFVSIIPSIFDSIKNWIDGLFSNLEGNGSFDVSSIKLNLFDKIETMGSDLTNSLPELTVNFVKSFFSGLGTFVIGLIIGFYLLISFDNTNESIVTVLPKNMQNDARDLMNEINTSLRRFVQGTLMLSTLIFLVTSLGLAIAGVKSPLLFGLFCGITNIIPFAGPYIGGVPAVIVAFALDVRVGIFALIVIVVVQFFEGNFFQPVIMSKTMKLHPVTIMLGLLIFGYFWGILGMILATPVISVCKSVIMFFDEKYNILTFND
ncbi:MAG: AI-2E family transporter [Bacilli bacterium]|nr:AI-2E family transporter [Bacilli bacterium]